MDWSAFLDLIEDTVTAARAGRTLPTVSSPAPPGPIPPGLRARAQRLLRESEALRYELTSRRNEVGDRLRRLEKRSPTTPAIVSYRL